MQLIEGQSLAEVIRDLRSLAAEKATSTPQDVRKLYLGWQPRALARRKFKMVRSTERKHIRGDRARDSLFKQLHLRRRFMTVQRQPSQPSARRDERRFTEVSPHWVFRPLRHLLMRMKWE